MVNLKKLKHHILSFALTFIAFVAMADVDYNMVDRIKVSKFHTTFVDTYDQLNAYQGRDGLVFVRNAAGKKTYNTYGIVTGTSGGDPTVQKENSWAIYVWDRYKVRNASGSYIGGWTKVAEEETLDANVYEVLLDKYVSKWDFTNFVAEVHGNYETIAQHNLELAIVNNALTNIRAKLGTLTTDVETMQGDVVSIDGKADRNRDDIITINQKLDSMQLDEVRRTLIDATNRVAVAEVRIDDAVTAVEEATNVVAQMQGIVSNHTEEISALWNGHNVNSQRIDAVEALVGSDAVAGRAYVDEAISNLTERIAEGLADAKHHSDTNDVNDVAAAKEYTDQTAATINNKLRYVDVDSMHILLGPNAENPTVPGSLYGSASINLCPYWQYPSYTYGNFNINLGIDNSVGFGTGTSTNSNGEIYNARYATAIGTSAKAKMMHSYAYGSQINALNGNTTVIGYGASATSDWSTVIGHGRRPNGGSSSYDKKFTSWTEADTYLKTLTVNTFKGSHFEVKENDIRTLYTIVGVRDTPDANGYYYDYLITPDDEYDYIPGGYDWRYGKSHGPGSFNIVAYCGSWRTSPGLRAVWINDDNLDDLVTASILRTAGGMVTKYGPELTQAQINKGITYVSNGYAENGAVEIGVDARALVDEDAVRALNTANSKIRNVGLAIGTRAVAEGSGATKNQSIAIGYCSHAISSCAMAIGPGARHLDDEDDLTGNNAYANGSTATAIGYSSKAIGTGALSIGAGISGSGIKNKAEGNYATAIGGASQATANQAVALGYQANARAVGAVQLGTGENTEANTLKFQNTTIVKNGKICGFDDTSLDPKEIDISEAVSNQSEEVTLLMKPHIVNTLATTVTCGPGTEIYLDPAGSRNYEVFIPNEEQFIHGLPLNLQTEFDDTTIKTVYTGKKDTASKLPVMVKIQQPTKKCVVITVNELDDGTDWTPVITNSFIKFDSVAGKFYCEGGKKSVEGTSLHHATEFKIVYPTDGGVATNDFSTADASGLISGTYYDYAAGFDFVPQSPVSCDDSQEIKTWYKIIYKTVNGDAEVFHKDLTSIVRE